MRLKSASVNAYKVAKEQGYSNKRKGAENSLSCSVHLSLVLSGIPGDAATIYTQKKGEKKRTLRNTVQHSTTSD